MRAVRAYFRGDAMPTYEYACKSCGSQWEEVQKISAPSTTVCPKCEQATAQRQISGGSFILKGGGWYADLYSSAKPGAASASSTGSASSGESKPAASSDSSAAAPAAAPAAPAAAAPAASTSKE